jgi:hypothetical protein
MSNRDDNPNLQARAELNKCPNHFRFTWNYDVIVPSDLRKKPEKKSEYGGQCKE